MASRSWVDKLSLRTYPVGPDDPNPPFQRQGTSWAVYPYTLQDDLLEGPPAYRDWTALHIENEYLHCTVLPELGGHIHSLFDKVTGREIFYRNRVVKYGLVAIRGKWVSGGVEFNFPTGHTHTTADPVSWQTGGDESRAWIKVGNIDRLSRMEWCVCLSLSAGERRLCQEVWLNNRMPYKQRHWFWSNSAVYAREDLRLVYPARKGGIGGTMIDYPINDGKDLSWYTAHDQSLDIFTHDVREDFFGCHYDRSDFGLIHVADHRLVRGKKFFTWGTSDDGDIWVDLLTDDDGQYAEIQSGRFETQSIWEFLEPYETVYWKEYWFPEHGMGGWVWANEDAAVNFESETTKLKLGALTTIRQDPVEISLAAAPDGSGSRRKVWSRELCLEPDRPFVAEIGMPPGCTEKSSFVLRLACLGDARDLIRYEHPPWHARQPKITETGENVVRPPKPEEECTTEELCVRAVDALRRLETGEARRLCAKALSMDAGVSSAHLPLGLLDYQAGLYASAREHLENAVARDPENDEAWSYLGLARYRTGEIEAAKDALWEASRRQQYKGIAMEFLLEIEAEEAEARDTAACEGIPDFMVYGLYGLNKYGDQQPTEPIANPVESFAHWARGDVQNWLEEAFSRSRPVAIRTMELACEHCPGADAYPMTHYCLAYWHRQLGHTADARLEYERARACPPDYCFPSRLEELEVLEAAIAYEPSDWKAHYYLGNLLASLGRTAEAMKRWREAARLDGEFAVLLRNLGLGAALWERDYEAAAAHYRRAIELNPGDYRYYLDLQNLYATHLGRSAQEQLDLLLGAPAAVLSKWQVAARTAEVLVELGMYDDAFALLRAHKFFPWEGALKMRTTYCNALVGKARALAAAGDHAGALRALEAALEYPRNIGVGKPARPQEARIHYLASREAAQVGDEAARDRHLRAAADELHRSPSPASYYKMLALRELGRAAEAAEVEKAIRTWANENLNKSRYGQCAKEILDLLGGDGPV